jgi:CheY-like chemotaxis protein
MRAAYDFDPLEPEGVEGRKCSHSNLPQMPQLEMMVPQPQIAPPLSVLRQSMPIDLGSIGGVAVSDGAPPLVLVVDDHEDSRVIMRLVAESVGLRVADARTGPEGLHAARSLLPSIVLLDLVLPGLDGWHIARLLRADARLRGTALIAVTASAAVEDLADARTAGCNEVLTKPMHPDSLYQSLERYVEFPRRPRGRAR